jgi:hypothetical protein
MRKARLNIIALALIIFACAGASMLRQFDGRPQGSTVQNVTAYLTGEGMNSAWHVIASRKLLGTQMGATPVYQWYVSFYAPTPAGPKLAYRLPDRDPALLAKVAKAPGADMYFPHADVRIIGAAELEQAGVQDAVVQIHQIGADCGSADVVIFGADTKMHVAPKVHVQNPCDLQASIVKDGALAAVRLTGPYYAPGAALCCPTKPRVTALLTFAKGKWLLRPRYFAVQSTRRQ